MSKNLKRRYPFIVIALAALFCGWSFLFLRSGQSIRPKDLDEYARNILRDKTLSKRDIAMIYALGQKNSPVSFDTPKRIVFSSLLNGEKVEVREEDSSPTNGNDDTAKHPVCSVTYSGGQNAHVNNYSPRDKDPANRSLEQAELNRAAIAAYLYLAKKSRLNDQFSMSVRRNHPSYWAAVVRVPFMPGGFTDIELSKDFKVVALIPGE